ncbi:hypothetical protein LQW54_004914 [Pestalotiopsis sp. IQ-011]
MDYAHYFNQHKLYKTAEIDVAPCMRNLSNWHTAVEEISTWPKYTPQPLHALPGLAKKLDISQFYVKDESQRFGAHLGSFKALDAPYAIYQLLAREVEQATGIRPCAADLRTSKYHDVTQKVTVCVATDGNQGRGLAYGAQLFGCRCIDYIHGHVSEGRAARMKELGAIVIRIDGEYEHSVARAREDARMNGWHFVSSTSWSDFDDGIPQDVMNAYMVSLNEALEAVSSVEDISHVFVCGGVGVGSIAAAIFQGFYTYLKAHDSSALPRFVLVEPSEADCLFQSASSGEARQSSGSLRTIMAGLACRDPSPAAWKILKWLGSGFLTVPDAYASNGMKALACPSEGNIPFVIAVFEAQKRYRDANAG